MSLELFAKELQYMWNPGTVHGDTIWRVGLVSGIWDGKGFEKVTKTHGSMSLEGCQACHFEGQSFARRVVYPSYSRYLDINNPRRLFRPPNTVAHNKLLYTCLPRNSKLNKEIRPPPTVKTYTEYLTNVANLQTDEKSKHVYNLY